MTKERKKIHWFELGWWIFVAGFALSIAIRGETEFDLGHVSGPTVRLGGGLLCAVGIVLAVRAVFRK